MVLGRRRFDVRFSLTRMAQDSDTELEASLRPLARSRGQRLKGYQSSCKLSVNGGAGHSMSGF